MRVGDLWNYVAEHPLVPPASLGLHPLVDNALLSTFVPYHDDHGTEQPMVHSMKVGSVTVDLAAATGGNIATTKADEVCVENRLVTFHFVSFRAAREANKPQPSHFVSISFGFSFLAVRWSFRRYSSRISGSLYFGTKVKRTREGRTQMRRHQPRLISKCGVCVLNRQYRTTPH